jgi:hypothetical protein
MRLLGDSVHRDFCPRWLDQDQRRPYVVHHDFIFAKQFWRETIHALLAPVLKLWTANVDITREPSPVATIHYHPPTSASSGHT